jgi:hypothetical protein
VRAFFTSYAYSASIYKDGYRNAANVERVTCLILDFDNKDPDAIYSIETALADFKPFWFVLHTTTNHHPGKDKFRVILPLSEMYQRLIRCQDSVAYNEFKVAIKKRFPLCDIAQLKLGRQSISFLGDPALFQLHINDGVPIDIAYSMRMHNDQAVRPDKSDIAVPLSSIVTYTRVHCPWDEDRDTSAFIDFTEDGRKFLHCSACQSLFGELKATWWCVEKEEKPEDVIEALNGRFAVCLTGGQVVILDEQNPDEVDFIKVPAFHQYMKNRFVAIPDHKGTIHQLAQSNYWMQHPDRRTYDRLVFNPGVLPSPGKTYNLWRGFGG